MGWHYFQELKTCHSLPYPQICTFFNIPHLIEWYHLPFITQARNLEIITGPLLPSHSHHIQSMIKSCSFDLKLTSTTNIYVLIRSPLMQSIATASILVSLPPVLPSSISNQTESSIPFYSNYGQKTSSTWELVRNVDSQAPPQIYYHKPCVLTRSQGDL